VEILMADFGKVLGRREEEQMWMEERGPGGCYLAEVADLDLDLNLDLNLDLFLHTSISAWKTETIFNVQIFQHGLAI
jgi:hypothetical protein